MVIKILFQVFFCIFLCFPIFADANMDQWKDSEKTYYNLIEEGFEVKAYDINNIEVQNGYIFMFFVTVLQKNNVVYECQEYQTLDTNMQTLDMNFVCRQLVPPYKKGLGT